MMESSQDEEECRSSESGWTLYLGSPMEDGSSTDGRNDDEDDDYGEEDEEEEEEEQSGCDNVGSVRGGGEEEDRDVGNEDDGHGRDSDDSMASDASSRPRHGKFWAKSDEKEKQGKGATVEEGRGKKVRKNLKMGKK